MCIDTLIGRSSRAVTKRIISLLKPLYAVESIWLPELYRKLHCHLIIVHMRREVPN